MAVTWARVRAGYAAFDSGDGQKSGFWAVLGDQRTIRQRMGSAQADKKMRFAPSICLPSLASARVFLTISQTGAILLLKKLFIKDG